MNAVAEIVNKKEHRAYKRGGCFNLTAVLVAPADRPHPDAPVSLAYSWLPLSEQRFDKHGPAGYRHPNVIPALGDRVFTRLAPAIDEYAAKRNWIVQPVLYFYRPQALVDFLGEDGLIKDLPAKTRSQKLEDRIFIDLTVQTETQSILEQVRALCVDVLNAAHINLPAYATSDNPRIALAGLIANFPFLVHHIFAAYPKLHVLRHKGRVNGLEDVVNHIRYSPDEVSDINTDKLFRPQMLTVSR